jgi:hypothetical protein
MKAVNLIPVDQRASAGPGAGRSGGGVYFVFGLLGGLALFALLYGLAAHQISSRHNQAASLLARAQQAQTSATQLAPYTSFVAMREQRVQAVSELVNSRFDWAHAFHELGRVLPSDASLSSIEGTVGSTSSAAGATKASTAGASVTSATPPGSIPTFTLIGCATSQAEVALTLDRLRLIDGVNEVALQSSANGGSGGGGCGGKDPAFTVQVTFDALPSISTTGAGTSAPAATTSSSSSTGAIG